MKALKTIVSAEYELNLVQANMKSFSNQLVINPVLDGVLIKGIVLESGVNTVDHKLGRKIQGWIITDINKAAQIYKYTEQLTPSRTIVLVTSIDVTVDIYFF